MCLLKGRQWELVQLAIVLLGFSHQASHHAVRFAKGHTVPYEVIGKVGGHHPARDCRLHTVGAELELGERSGDGGEDQHHRVGRVEQCALVVLQILVVAAREPLESGEKSGQVANDTSSGATSQFERIRVALLRHHARAG